MLKFSMSLGFWLWWCSIDSNGQNTLSTNSRAFCFQFHDVFTLHFLPHQFGVVVKDECEDVVHGVQIILDIHPNWVVLHVDIMNAFRSISCTTIF